MPNRSQPSTNLQVTGAHLVFLVALILSTVGCDGQQRKQPPPYPLAEAKSAYWPRWSGPNSDLISREPGWSADWPKDGLRVAWETNVGIGFSSVSVAEGRLFTMGHRDGREYVFCFDTGLGQETLVT